MMSGVGVDAKVYASTNETVATSVETSVLTATAQIAQYVHQDLERFVEQYHIPIARDLEFRGYDDNPRKFIRLLCGDIERLLNDKLITSLTFILSDPSGKNGRYRVRYRAIYRIGRDINPTQFGRSGGYLMPPEEAIPGAKFSLVAEWSRESAGTRAEAFKNGRYSFIWVPVNQAIFDDSLLSATYNEGRFRPTEGEQLVIRLEQARKTF